MCPPGAEMRPAPPSRPINLRVAAGLEKLVAGRERRRFLSVAGFSFPDEPDSGTPKVYGLARLQLGYALSLADQAHIARVSRLVAEERRKWHADLDALGWRRTRSQANFVFFRGDRPQADLARALAARGVDIGRAHPPLVDWTRISIGLPQENDLVRTALRTLV